MKFFKFLVLAISLSSSLLFAAQSPWLIRVRAIDVIPFPSSSPISGVGGHVTKGSSQAVPEVDFSYFFTSHISAELILATSRHTLTATGTSLGDIPLGKVSILPPTLTLQYHFLPCCMFNPYVGVGVNYTYFFNVRNGPVASSTKYRSSFGPAFQVGFDIAIDDHWLLNFDVKRFYIESKVHLNTALGGLHTTAKLYPLIVGGGIGYRF